MDLPSSSSLDHPPSDRTEGRVVEALQSLVDEEEGCMRLLHCTSEEGDNPPPVGDGTLSSVFMTVY